MNKHEITEILNKTIDPRELAKEQYIAYKNYIIEVLVCIKNHIQQGQFNEVREMCFESPAGDEAGWDNMVIDFGTVGKNMDIVEAIEKLEKLRDVSMGY